MDNHPKTRSEFGTGKFQQGEHTVTLAIYGAGGLGREVYDTAMAQHNPEWDSIVFVDDFNFDRQLYGVDVVSFPQLVDDVGIENVKVIIGIGEPSVRAKISDRLKNVYNAHSVN